MKQYFINVSWPQNSTVVQIDQSAQDFCICRGTLGKDADDFYVACDGGEKDCKNGGWLHKKCVPSLVYLTVDDADKMGEFFCEDCEKNKKDEDEEIKKLREEAEKLDEEEEALENQDILNFSEDDI